MANEDFTKTITSQTIDIKLSKRDSKVENMSTLCTDIFLIVIKMREAKDLGETAALRKLIIYYLKQFEKNCSVLGVKSDVVESVKYALVAILDETVLSIPGEARDFWIGNPMQLEIFGDNIAGQEFYNKLDNLLINPEANSDALEVFYLCLSLGFQGKYLIDNTEEREKIIVNLARTLIKSKNTNVDVLSPHAARLTIMKKSRGVKQPVFLPHWILGTVMSIVLLVVWIVIRLSAGTNI